MTCRVVMGADFSGKAGQYFCTGASRSSLPRSTNSIAAVAVKDLEMEARRNRVCSLTGNIVLEVGETESGGPFHLTVFDDGDGESRNMGGRHEPGDSGLDLSTFLGRERVLLGGAQIGENSAEQSENQHTCNRADRAA